MLAVGGVSNLADPGADELGLWYETSSPKKSLRGLVTMERCGCLHVIYGRPNKLSSLCGYQTWRECVRKPALSPLMDAFERVELIQSGKVI